MSVVKPAIQYPVLIAYLEGASNYTWLHFRDGDKQLLAKSISYLEKTPELTGFVRAHKTILLNPACVERLVAPPRPKMAGMAVLATGELLPVSRRRWNEVVTLLSFGGVVPPVLRTRSTTEPHPPALVTAPDRISPRSVVAVTDSPSSALLLHETADRRWPQCTFHVRDEALSLPDLLGQLPKSELPVLLLLDARTARQEHLNALRQIKRNDQLRRIPVILLVSPTDKAVYDGYQSLANSVITVSGQHTQFVQTIERVGRFWLETAVLPGMAGATCGR